MHIRANPFLGLQLVAGLCMGIYIYIYIYIYIPAFTLVVLQGLYH